MPLRLTARGGWDDDTVNSILERVYGKNPGHLVGYFAFGAALLFHQVRNFSFNLWRNFVYRLGVELPGGARYAAQGSSCFSRGSLSLKFFFLSLQSVVSFLFASPLGAEEINIYFKTSPKVEFLRPYADPANLSLLVTAADGRPLERGSVEIRLDAPKSGRFFSTDFPIVEGTRLTELRLPLRQGRANWKYLFPIRGEYNLAVEVESGDGKKARKDFQIKINENSISGICSAGFV